MKQSILILLLFSLQSCSVIYDYECTREYLQPGNPFIATETIRFNTLSEANEWCEQYHQCNCIKVNE